MEIGASGVLAILCPPGGKAHRSCVQQRHTSNSVAPSGLCIENTASGFLFPVDPDAQPGLWLLLHPGSHTKYIAKIKCTTDGLGSYVCAPFTEGEIKVCRITAAIISAVSNIYNIGISAARAYLATQAGQGSSLWPGHSQAHAYATLRGSFSTQLPYSERIWKCTEEQGSEAGEIASLAVLG